MNNARPGALLVFLAIGCLSQSVSAQSREIDYATSQLSFTVKQMGVPVEGIFKKFIVKLDFDPANLVGANAWIEIDMSSIDTGSEEGDTEIKRRPWFNVKEFPIANFISNSLDNKGNSHYEALGKLSIKGKSQDVALPFRVVDDANATTFAGQFMIKRSAFGIGSGAWSDTDMVADEVTVRFNLTLAPLKK